ncbi:tetratricopeptide repeat protein [Paenibacillus sp. GYB003]|uniref:tetratricopeptide repeat protein n=1 Tax=Paenibacillus sp. GYB003 TaxID=2994392 RepID=UPI002F961E27
MKKGSPNKVPRIVKPLILVVLIAAVLVIAFRTHWALGLGAVVVLAAGLALANRPAIYAQRGNAAYAKGDTTEALAWLEKAYRTKRMHPLQQVGYGYLLLKTGEPERAEAVLQQVASTAKNREAIMQARINLSTALWLRGRREEALGLLEDVFGEFKNTTVYGNLGYFKLLGGDLEEALAFNLEAYAYNDDDMTIADNLAQTYYMLDRLEEAEDIYAKVIVKSPKHADSYYYYARTLQRLGRTGEAREQAERARDKELALVTTLTRDDVERLARELGASEETATSKEA